MTSFSSRNMTAPTLVAVALCLLLSPTPGHAYLDPGTGGMAIQALIAILAGTWLAIRLFWSRIVRFFKPKGSDSASPDSESS